MQIKNKNLLKMIIPSLIGVLLFLVPIRHNGKSEIIVGIICSWLKTTLGDSFIYIISVVIVISALLTLIHKIHPIPFLQKSETLNRIFSTSVFWTVTRVVGSIITVLTLFKIGPEIFWADDTGSEMLTSIIPNCAVWYFVGGFLLPFLTEYGLLEIFSSLFRRVAKPLFKVPGRSMIDCVTSWVGSSICGTYLTISQYEDGYYTAKEASIIISNFSLLSISFCSLICSMLGLDGMFGKFYLTICIAGIICAIITPRIPPIKLIPDKYDELSGKKIAEEAPENVSNLKWGYTQALKRATGAPGPKKFLKEGAITATELMVNTLSVVMAFGTIALILANHTTLFHYLGVPIGMYLKLFNVPDAMNAGAAILVGFADQFIPVVLGATMTSTLTKFVVGCCSILQIVYISDIGALIFTSRLKLSIMNLFIIFVERILICIPIIILCAKMFGIA